MTAKRFTFDEDVNEDYMYEMGVFSDNGKVMETTDVLNCLNELHEENQKLKKLNIPIDEIKDTVSDYRGRIIGVYYND